MNIVQLHGFIIEDNRLSLVLEWVPNGTIIEYLKDHPQCDRVKLVCPSMRALATQSLTLFQCQGIANGIEYLHIRMDVIHSDLKGVRASCLHEVVLRYNYASRIYSSTTSESQ